VAGDVGESSVDAWHSPVGWKGATWLSRGLPRGTPRLVHWLLYKIWLWHGRGFETVTSWQANGLAERSSHPGGRWNLLIKRQYFYLNLISVLTGEKKGRGVAPTLGVLPCNRRPWNRERDTGSFHIKCAKSYIVWPVGLLYATGPGLQPLFWARVVTTYNRGHMAYNYAKEPGVSAPTGGAAHSAWPHGPPYDHAGGARARIRGLAPINFIKVGFF
jgi:hypothetical protein